MVGLHVFHKLLFVFGIYLYKSHGVSVLSLDRVSAVDPSVVLLVFEVVFTILNSRDKWKTSFKSPYGVLNRERGGNIHHTGFEV